MPTFFGPRYGSTSTMPLRMKKTVTASRPAHVMCSGVKVSHQVADSRFGAVYWA